MALVGKLNSFIRSAKKEGKSAQHLSPALLADCRVSHAISPDRPEYLLALYADAERTLPLLRAMCDTVVASVLRCIPEASVRRLIAPLKGQPRAVVKTLEKYGGHFSRLTDLARATFEETVGNRILVSPRGTHRVCFAFSICHTRTWFDSHAAAVRHASVRARGPGNARRD